MRKVSADCFYCIVMNEVETTVTPLNGDILRSDGIYKVKLTCRENYESRCIQRDSIPKNDG
jgi:hypothetical protein